MSERTDISFDAALMMALRADAQREPVSYTHLLSSCCRILFSGRTR